MEYIFEFLLFSGKFLLFFIFLFIFLILLKISKNAPNKKLNQIEIININQEYAAVEKHMLLNVLEKSQIKKRKKKKIKKNRQEKYFCLRFFW